MVLLLAVTALAAAPAPVAAADRTEAAIAYLRTALHSQRDGSHLPLLFALRQLRDPQLRPLFEHLVDHHDWQVRVHAVLALAEINSAGNVDPALIGRVGPAAQEAVIASAIDLQLLGGDQMAQVLALENIGDLPRLMLHAELVLLAREIDHDDVRKLIEHVDLRVAGLASMLLAKAGDGTAFQSFQSRYTKAPPRMQRNALPWLLDAIRQYRLTVATPWLRSLHEDGHLTPRDKQFVVLTAFEIDPPGNIDLWRAFLGTSPAYSQAVRAGFMLLAAGENAPPQAYDELRRHHGDDDLLIRLAAAGKALAAGGDPGDAMIALLDLGHPRTTEWVMSTLRERKDATAERVYRHLIEQADREGGRSERIALAVTAAARLFDLDPEWVIAKLLNTNTSQVLQQALLLGMFESDSPRVGEAAAALTTVGVGRETSLRTLLIARHAQELSDDDRRQLGIIAAGGGRVSDVLRAQAAWLYLKHTGETAKAIERLVAS